MSDQLNNFENIKGRFSKVRIYEKERLRKGFEGKKLFVYAEINSDNVRARRVAMFLKSQNSEIDIENVFEKYKKLKELGFPVPPTFRIDKQERKILMTDLTEGGIKRIVDIHEKEYLPDFANTDELRADVYDLNERAYENGILLGSPAFAIVTDPQTRIGKIYILDLGEVMTIDEYAEYIGREISQKDVDRYLEISSMDFISEYINHE